MSDPDIEDALYSACCVTTKARPTFSNVHIPNHPRAIGTFNHPPSSVIEFRAKLRAFLREVDSTLTVAELLEELQ